VQWFGVAVIQVIDGKIVEEWIYFNAASIFQQIGFTITPPTQPEKE